MNSGSQSQHRRILPLWITEARWSFGWLVPSLVIFAVRVARAQPIGIDPSASGFGPIEAPFPRPDPMGQGFVARAMTAAAHKHSWNLGWILST